jgi:hypothetical protein
MWVWRTKSLERANGVQAKADVNADGVNADGW